MSDTSWAPNPDKHLYTWSFTKRSILMRYFLWLYEADQQSMTFCRFFWGMVCSPIALPIRLIKGFFRVLWIVLKFAGHTLAAFGKFMQGTAPIQAASTKASEIRSSVKTQRRMAKDQKMAERDAAVAAHLKSLWDEMDNPTPPEPAKPSVQTKIADGAGAKVDWIVAWFQARPKIMATASKIVTRCIFYPLAFIIPSAIAVGVLYEGYEHRSGGTGFLHAVWSDVISGIALAAKDVGKVFMAVFTVVGPLLLKVIALGLAAAVIFTGIAWLLVIWDDKKMKKEYDSFMEMKTRNGGSVDAREAPSSLFLLKARASIDRRREATARRLSPFAKSAGRRLMVPGKAAGHGIAVVARTASMSAKTGGRGVGKAAAATGHGVKRSGSFVAVAHHAVKYRTCPRIEITE